MCEDLTDLFALMETFDIAVAHDPYRAVYQVARVVLEVTESDISHYATTSLPATWTRNTNGQKLAYV